MARVVRDWLAHRADVTPDATAVVTPAGEDAAETTYATLDERVEELAGRLAALGVGVEDHLGVVARTRPAFVELAHAAMRVGAVLVPLNARLTATELAPRIERTDLSALVAGGATADTAREAAPADLPVACLDGGTGLRELSTVAPESYDLPAWSFDSPQTVLFTSGTTGEPKAVVLTMGNLLASAVASAFRLGVREGDRWHVPLPMYHAGGLAPTYRSVLYGSAVSVPAASDGEAGFDAERTAGRLRTAGATCVSLVPTQLRRLLDAGADLSALRFVLLGGAPAPEALVQRALDRDVAVRPTYGTTETASQIATARPDEVATDPGTVGSPLLFTDVSVVDEYGRTRPPGEAGELVVSGPTVTPGYYDDPERTDAAFGPEGLRTGDVGRRDEAGRLHVLNRTDDRIVTGGENVDPGEVAGALREHPEVRDAVVVGLEDAEWGQRVAALVAADGEVAPSDLAGHCDDRLAGFKQPRTVAVTESLPRTASGTVDREAAREVVRRAGAEVGL